MVKDYVDGKGIIKEEKSEEKGVELREQNPKEPKLTSMDSLVMLDNTVKNGELIKSQSLDSGLDVISRETDDSDKRVRRNSYSPSTDSGVSMGSIESEQPKQTKIVRYNTTGDGNCFFHAVFGDSSSGQYKAERAQDMRMEWNKFLSQFKSLGDSSMPTPLKEQLEKVFNMFLNKPGDLTGKSDKIRKLVDHMKKEIKNAEDNVEKLVSKAVSKLNISRDQAIHNLKEYAEALYGLGENEYNTQYSSEFITQSFLNKPELYQAYLEAIKSQSYFIFIEEISILASLANIEINVYYKDNNSEEQKKFEPNLQMINDDQLNQIFNRESYKLNDELWGSKERETIYLEGNHYSRAKIVTQELIKQQQEQEDFLLAKQLQIDEILEYCDLSKDISERVEIEREFDELLAKNADGKIGDVIGQCINDVQQRIKCLEEPVLSRRCSVEEARVEKTFYQQQVPQPVR